MRIEPNVRAADGQKNMSLVSFVVALWRRRQQPRRRQRAQRQRSLFALRRSFFPVARSHAPYARTLAKRRDARRPTDQVAKPNHARAKRRTAALNEGGDRALACLCRTAASEGAASTRALANVTAISARATVFLSADDDEHGD